MTAGVNEAGILKQLRAKDQSVQHREKGMSHPNCLLFINICKLRLKHACDLPCCFDMLSQAFWRLRIIYPAAVQKVEANLVTVTVYTSAVISV